MTEPRLAVTFWARAARQVESAGQWWRENRQDSPEALSEELVRTLDLIARQPGVGLPATNSRLSGIKRILLPRVGYLLFYRVAPRASHGRSDLPWPSTAIAFGRSMKIREILQLLRADGWFVVATRGSHIQLKHLSKRGRVTVAGHPSDDLAPGTLKSILVQAGLKEQ